MGANNIKLNQRSPLALTKWPWLERTGSRPRSVPRALILTPRRRSIVSRVAKPHMIGPVGTKVCTNNFSKCG